MSHSHLLKPRALFLFVVAALSAFSYGCSIPRIVILNDPLVAEEHRKLGRIYESQGKFELAAEQYEIAIKQDPKAVSSLLLLGDLSYRTKKYPEAESAYRKAVKLQPGNGDIYNNLCWIHMEQNRDLEEAEGLVEKALEATPEHRAYYLDTRGVVFLRQGRTAEAIAALTEALELLPAEPVAPVLEAYGHLAEAYRAGGDEAKAREAERSATRYRD
jgi:tetratricopeptide (TPR) repeat protein